MDQEYILVNKLAGELGIDKGNFQKYIKKIGIMPIKIRNRDSRHQKALAVTKAEADQIIATREEQGFTRSQQPEKLEIGHFYIVQLVPEIDPNRVKFGFASNVATRLAQHRTTAPTLRLVKKWPCKMSWESTIIDCLTVEKCKLIFSEVFQIEDLNDLIERSNTLFEMLPDPKASVELYEHSPLKEKLK